MAAPRRSTRQASSRRSEGLVAPTLAQDDAAPKRLRRARTSTPATAAAAQMQATTPRRRRRSAASKNEADEAESETEASEADEAEPTSATLSRPVRKSRRLSVGNVSTPTSRKTRAATMPAAPALADDEPGPQSRPVRSTRAKPQAALDFQINVPTPRAIRAKRRSESRQVSFEPEGAHSGVPSFAGDSQTSVPEEPNSPVPRPSSSKFAADEKEEASEASEQPSSASSSPDRASPPAQDELAPEAVSDAESDKTITAEGPKASHILDNKPSLLPKFGGLFSARPSMPLFFGRQERAEEKEVAIEEESVEVVVSEQQSYLSGSSSPNIQAQLQFGVDSPMSTPSVDDQTRIEEDDCSKRQESPKLQIELNFRDQEVSSSADCSPADQLAMEAAFTQSDEYSQPIHTDSRDSEHDSNEGEEETSYALVKSEPQGSEILSPTNSIGYETGDYERESSEPAQSMSDIQNQDSDQTEQEYEDSNVSLPGAGTPPDHKRELESTPVSSSPSHFDEEMAFHELSPIVEVPEPPEESFHHSDTVTPLSSSPPPVSTPQPKARLSLFGTPTISKLVTFRPFGNTTPSQVNSKKRSLDDNSYSQDNEMTQEDDQDPSQMKRRRTQIRQNLEAIHNSYGSDNRATNSNNAWKENASSAPQKSNRQNGASAPSPVQPQTPFQTPKSRSAPAPFETPGGHVQVAVTEEQASWYSAFMTPIRNFLQSKPSKKIRGFTFNIIPSRSKSTSTTPTSSTVPTGEFTFKAPNSTSSSGMSLPQKSWVPPHIAGEVASASTSSTSSPIGAGRQRVSIRDVRKGQTEHLISQLKMLNPLQEDLDLVMDAWTHAKFMAQKAASIDAKREGHQFILRGQPGAVTASSNDIRFSERAYEEHLREYEAGVIDVIRGRIKAAFQAQPDRFKWQPGNSTIEVQDKPATKTGEKREERTHEPFEEDEEEESVLSVRTGRPVKRTRTENAPNGVSINTDQLPTPDSEQPRSGASSATSKAVRFLSPRSQAIHSPSEDNVGPSPSTPTPLQRAHNFRTTPHPKSALSKSSLFKNPSTTPFVVGGSTRSPRSDTALSSPLRSSIGSNTSFDSGKTLSDSPLKHSQALVTTLSEDEKKTLRHTGHLPGTGIFAMPDFSDTSDDEESDNEEEPVTISKGTISLFGTPRKEVPEKPAKETPKPLIFGIDKASVANYNISTPPVGGPDSLLKSCLKKPGETINVFAAAESANPTKAPEPVPSPPQSAMSTTTTASAQPPAPKPVAVEISVQPSAAAPSPRPAEPVFTKSRAIESSDFLTGRQVLGMLNSAKPLDYSGKVDWPAVKLVEDRSISPSEESKACEYLKNVWSAVC